MQKHIPPSSPPAGNILTEAQWQTLAALADAIIPSITSRSTTRSSTASQVLPDAKITEVKTALARTIQPDPVDEGLEDEYLQESAIATPAFKDAVLRYLGMNADSDTLSGLQFILTALGTRAGAVLLTKRTAPIVEQPLLGRQNILREWKDSYLPFYRSLYRAFTQITCIFWIRTSPTLGRLLTYPGTPINHNFGKGFPFEFLQFPLNTYEETVETDVVIIGSGCTGAVAASILAQAGLSVIVVDKSYYWPPEYLPMTELNASQHIFQNGGITPVDGGLFSVIFGSVWGGGGTVNWSASLQLQNAVRQEWSKSSGLPYFTSPAFQTDLDAVCSRMGVSTEHVKHNASNSILLEGARRLGMTGKTVPQNTGGEAHQCGYCTLGCGSCGKKGPTETWLPDAAKHGATFIEGFSATNILFSDSSPRRATGVTGTWTSRSSSILPHGPDSYTRRVTISARKAVISAASALHTPVLLKRSGLTSSHIGSHLKLHPVSLVAGIFPQPTKPWEGAILTSVVTDLENLDGRHHGVKLEATTMLPGWFLPFFAWNDALDWKLWCARMRHAAGYIALARDSGEGRVYIDPKHEGRARIAYDVNTIDRKHIARGVEALARIVYTQGAVEIRTNVPWVPAWLRPSASPTSSSSTSSDSGSEEADRTSFETWLDAHIAPLVRKGHPTRDAAFASAHQMGSCRMGSSSKTSAVDGRGRPWGTEGLYVVDTSVFPAASGVNPMVTGMGVARGLARGMVEEFVGKDGGRARL